MSTKQIVYLIGGPLNCLHCEIAANAGLDGGVFFTDIFMKVNPQTQEVLKVAKQDDDGPYLYIQRMFGDVPYTNLAGHHVYDFDSNIHQGISNAPCNDTGQR